MMRNFLGSVFPRNVWAHTTLARKMPILVLALAMPVGVAVAEAPEGPAYRPEILQNCLAAKTGDEDRSVCIGASSDDCMTSAQGQTTAGMVQCLGLELADWDNMLNDTYRKLVTQQKAADAALAASGSSIKPQRVEKLQKMQRDWISYRDAACQFDAAQWDGGSGSGPSATGCALGLTGHQALFLGQYLDREQ